MKKTIIKSVGKYIPNRIVTNKELETYMDTTDEWIYQRTGIKERRWVSNTKRTTSSDLALEASKKALYNANWNPDELDLIIFATQVPDVYIPGSGPILQHKLGIDTTPTIDIRQQCTGFLYGLMLADSLIRSNSYNKILLACAEEQSTGIDVSTKGRTMSILFADGAGSICLEGIKTEKNVGVIGVDLHTQGEFYKNIILDMHPSYKYDWYEKEKHWPQMNGNLVFVHAIKRLNESISKVLKDCNMTIEDIDIIIPHQANKRINDQVSKVLNIPEHKMFSNIHKYGNTTSASIPIALEEVLEEFPDIKTIMFTGFGAGETWGTIIYRYPG